MTTADHLEQHLGEMERGWASLDSPELQVCLFRNQPHQGLQTLASLGLSNSTLTMKGKRRVRQELLFVCGADESADEYAKLVLEVAEAIAEGGKALLRGDVFDLRDRIHPRSTSTALYVSMPVVFPEELATLEDSSPATVFAWLFPVLPAEEKFIHKNGWSAFEDLLETENPPLFDLARKSLV